MNNAPDSLLEYWNKNLKNKKPLIQLDALKNLCISTRCIDIKADTILGKKIAHNNSNKLWLNKKEYSKNEVIAGLIELDCFPIIMPVTGEINTLEDIKEYWSWINAFERSGINILKQLSFGFEIKEPVRENKVIASDFGNIFPVDKLDDENFGNLFELHQMSKQFKYIDNTTKVIFVRNRIPRTLIKSKIKPRASLVTLGGGFFSGGNDNLKRFLENLPKKLYYSDSQPSNWDWNDKIIIKL